MDRGIDFLRGQVANAVMQHRTLLQSLEDHESQAQDARFRDLCSRHIPKMREHQRMLEDYQRALGGREGIVKKAAGVALGVAKDLAEVGERHHDEYVREANRLVQQMFVEHVRGAEDAARVSEQPTQPL